MLLSLHNTCLSLSILSQIRVGTTNENRGKAFVVYEDIYDAKNALDHLNGFNVCGRYLVSPFLPLSIHQLIPTETHSPSQVKSDSSIHPSFLPLLPSSHPLSLPNPLTPSHSLVYPPLQVVLYYQPEKQQKRMDIEKQRKEVEELRKMVETGKDTTAAAGKA